MRYKQGIAPLGLVIILALLLGGGYIVYKAINNRGPASDSVVSETGTTKDWKTYRNEEYGFEFEYPADWVTRADKSGFYLYKPDPRKESEQFFLASYAIRVSNVLNPKQLPVEQWFKETAFLTGHPITERMTVANVPAIRVENDLGVVSSFAIYIGKGTSVVNIGMSDQSGYRDVFERILSTFKFTK